jgi:outer membrane protein TolC
MHKTMRFFHLAIFLGCFASILFCPRLLVAADNVEARDKIKSLLQDRLAVLRRIQQIATTQYEKGAIGADVLRDAGLSVLKARLDLCETKEERIGVHQDMVTDAEAWDKLAQAEYKSGAQRTELDALRARAYLLDCRIDLEKARTKR